MADFETRVPIPVVTVNPNEINLDDLEDGLITAFQLNITNHGLIRADDVNIHLPAHPLLDFSTTSLSLGDLEALSSVVIVVNSSRRLVQKRNTDRSDCAPYPINVAYSYICKEVQTRNTPVVLKSPVLSPCQLTDPVRREISGDGGRNGGGGTSGNTGDAADLKLDFEFGELEGQDSRPGFGSSSFNGYSASADTSISCNPCVSSIVMCLESIVPSSPLDLIPIPKPLGLALATCIPIVVVETKPLSIVSGAIDVLQCARGNSLTGLALCAYQQDLFNKCLPASFLKAQEEKCKKNTE